MKSPTADQIEPLYDAVGCVVLHWALLDQQIAHIAGVLYRATPIALRDRAMPVQFKRRTDFLRKCAAPGGVASAFGDDIRRVCDAAMEVLPCRDALVHGVISGFDPTTGIYEFAKLDIKSGEEIHTLNTRRTDLETLAELGRYAGEATTFAIGLVERIMQTVKPISYFQPDVCQT